MRWKLSVILLAAMVCLALTGVSAADDVKFHWDKPCGTIVEQCDKETVFTLNDVDPETVIAESVDGTYYVVMRYFTDSDGERVISTGDIRLTAWKDKFDPNTKVARNDGDRGNEIERIIDNPIKYMDINDNGIYDLYDPVYIDVSNNSQVSPGDIRLTAVPPVDVYSLELTKLEYGKLLIEAGEWGYEAWSIVKTGDKDAGMSLTTIGSGQAVDLLGYVDADDSGDWTCPDKLYIRAPNEYDWFQDVVTINDVRLYIPPDEECIPECGTKVVQGDKDATYALTPLPNATLVKVEGEGPDGKDAIYINMDGSQRVTVGDVRLTDVCDKFDRKTKVKPGDCDLGNVYVTLPNDRIRYAEVDGLTGYSLGDPLYIALDGDNLDEVSKGDYRLTYSPLLDLEEVSKGDWGVSGTFVRAGTGITDDGDVGLPLSTIGDIGDIIGFIDSDATGTWTCPDKLYFQQLFTHQQLFTQVDESCDYYCDDYWNNWSYPHDMFVTVGDYRVYEPISDETSPFYGLEEWPESSNKVFMCNKDATYVLTKHFTPVESLIKYDDANDNEKFDNGDHVYIDMDNNNRVSVGDIRLTDVIVHSEDCEHFYANNTKVQPKDKDIGRSLFTFTADEYHMLGESDRDLLSLIEEDMITEDGELGFSVKIFDSDCSKDWTCVDGLYLQRDHFKLGTASEGYNEANMCFVTHKNARLFIPPEYVVGGEGPELPMPDPEYHPYDLEQTGMINLGDVSQAIDDYLAGQLSLGEVSEIIDLYLSGEPY